MEGLKNTLKGIILIAMALMLATSNSCKQAGNEESSQQEIILSVNAYSFADLLSAKESRDNDQVYSLFNLLDWCNSQNIEALDPTAYFFPTYPTPPSDEYLQKFKQRADELGIAISGTGIRNNFASPDSAVRAEGVALSKEWIAVASKLGAPVLRVFAGAIPKGYEDSWEVPAQWMIECYKELIPMAQQYNVKIGIQNHREMLQTADQCLYVLERVNSEWAGIIIDTGNFTTENPYNDIERLIPYAVNWQVKEFTDGYGGSTKMDYTRLMKILLKSGYKGYLPVETLKVRGDFYDPFQRVSNMIKNLQKAMKIELM